MSDEVERERLRQTFDEAATSYQSARPEYPAELYEDLLAVTALPPGDRILEIGCATGKGTLPLARRGFAITCIELGADLARAARANLAGYDVSVVEGTFESWRPPGGERFGLVFAATAWHWIDPAVRYQRAWAALRPGGHLAFWSAAHVFPDGGDPIFDELQTVYDEIGESKPEDVVQPRPGELPTLTGDIEASGLFDVVQVRQFDWEVRYTAEQYIALLNTFSGHIAMAGWQRDRLFSVIRERLSERPDGRLRRHWGTVLQVARRREVPATG
ncbi:MAG TPA: class I SAM-dependent methyltransferase [Streptosporangiaceae bacterium]